MTKVLAVTAAFGLLVGCTSTSADTNAAPDATEAAPATETPAPARIEPADSRAADNPTPRPTEPADVLPADTADTSSGRTEAPDQEILDLADGLSAVVAIENVRVFDGETVIDSATIVFRDGVIVSVDEKSVDVPATAHLVDGAGRTLLPGLIDAHTHSLSEATLELAARFGVTTHLDMFTEPRWLAQERLREAAERDSGPRTSADLYSAGILGTVSGGHGTQYGIPIPVIDAPEAAAGWVQDRVAEGSDFIKLVIEDGSAFGFSSPSMDEATLQAAIAEAHAQGLLAVTHISKSEAASLAIVSGSDGLVHLFMDVEADPKFVNDIVAADAFVIPTLVVLSSTSSRPSGVELVDDPLLADRLGPDELASLRRRFPARLSLDNALRSVKLLHDAGVPILAGSDAQNPGTIFGASMHGELELLTEAGLSPVAALTAATATAADVFSLSDRGRIAPGLIADLVLVRGDPTTDILASRAIDAVWKDGLPVPLD